MKMKQTLDKLRAANLRSLLLAITLTVLAAVLLTVPALKNTSVLTVLLLVLLPVALFFWFRVMIHLMEGVSIRWFDCRGAEALLEDIDPEEPTFAGSQVYCGKEALFSARPFALIPFREVVWVYSKHSSARYNTTSKTCVLITKEGKRFELFLNDEDTALLAARISAVQPKLVEGCGKDKEKQVEELWDSYRRAKRRRLITDIAIAAVTAGLLIACLILGNNAPAFLQGLFGIGLLLVLVIALRRLR